VAQTFSFEQFRSIACVVLGGLIGALIGLPASLHTPAPFSALLPIVTLLLGILSGYRHRKSIGFFYFALVCVCALSAVVGTSGLQPEITSP
jgi:hypothetical protein